MLFWIICGGLALAVGALVAMPLLQGGSERDPVDTEVALYRAQLDEIDRDIARGVLAGDEAERARTEVARRLLAADAATQVSLVRGPQQLTLAVALVAFVVVAGGGALLYWRLGALDGFSPYPDIPRQARIEASAEIRAERPGQEDAMQIAAMLRPREAPGPELLDMLDQLRAALRQNSDDREGWTWLVRAEAGAGNYSEALAAQAHLVTLMPENSAAQQAEMTRLLDLMVSFADGYVSPEAEELAEILLSENPGSLPGRYYIGLLYFRTDRPDLAFRLWRSLVEDGPIESPHVMLARDNVEDAAFLAGNDYRVPPLQGPTAEDMIAAEDMTPEARAAMIRSMVDGLSNRLATDGGPAEDWARLIASLGVLGEMDQARAILAEARQVFGDREADMAVINAAATEAGLE